MAPEFPQLNYLFTAPKNSILTLILLACASISKLLSSFLSGSTFVSMSA